MYLTSIYPTCTQNLLETLWFTNKWSKHHRLEALQRGKQHKDKRENGWNATKGKTTQGKRETIKNATKGQTTKEEKVTA